MHNFKFLTCEQVFSNNKLDVIEKRGALALVTDYSLLLNVLSDDNNTMILYPRYVFGEENEGYIERSERKYGLYWLAELPWKPKDDNDYRVYCAGSDSYNKYIQTEIITKKVFARPVFSYALLSEIPVNVDGIKKRAVDGVLEVEYGYYPQTAPSNEIQKKLEDLFQTKKLKKSNNTYTIGALGDSKSNSLRFCKELEYEYKNKYYVRMECKCDNSVYRLKLSNGESYGQFDVIWFEVEPVKWLVSEDRKLMISEKLLFSGVPFGKKNSFYTFKNSYIKKYLNKYFSKELLQAHELLEEKQDIDLNLDDNDDIMDIDLIPTNMPQISDNTKELIRLFNDLINSEDELYDNYKIKKSELERKLADLEQLYEAQKKELQKRRNEVVELVYKTEDISSEDITNLKQKIRRM